MNLLSVHEAAELLGFSRQWVWSLIKMGRLEAQKIGKAYVVKENELNNFNDSKKSNKEVA